MGFKNVHAKPFVARCIDLPLFIPCFSGNASNNSQHADDLGHAPPLAESGGIKLADQPINHTSPASGQRNAGRWLTGVGVFGVRVEA
jgi:hypothetical protein